MSSSGVDLTEAGVAIGVVASLLSACEFALIFSSGSLIIAFWYLIILMKEPHHCVADGSLSV